MSERGLRHQTLHRIISQVEAEDMEPRPAIELAVELGFLAIGTAMSDEGYAPRIQLTFQRDEGSPGWRPLIVNERGGTIPQVRAGKVAELALLCALCGDVNLPFQREHIDRRLLEKGKAYDMGTFGWRYNSQTGLYTRRAHPHILQAAQKMPPDEVIGEVDFVEDDGSFEPIPNEPGQFASSRSHETVGTMPIRARGIQMEVGRISTVGYAYQPIQLER